MINKTIIRLWHCIPFVLFSSVTLATSTLQQDEHAFILSAASPEKGLLMEKGTYVAGIANAEAPYSLCLSDNGHTCKRVLVAPQKGNARFFFVTSSDSNTLIATTQSQINITLQKIVPKAHQVFNEQRFDSPAIAQAYTALANGKSSAEVWTALTNGQVPIVESTTTSKERLLTFVHKGAKHNVLVFGAPDRDHGWMERLGESDIWYKTYKVPDTALLSYQLAPDVPQFKGTPFEQRVALKATAQRDALNPQVMKSEDTDPYLQFSVVAMPNAAPQQRCVKNCVLSGRIETISLTSELLQNTRDITVYHSPANLHPGQPIQLLLFDGVQYMTEVNILATLELAVVNNLIPPFQAVLIDAIDIPTRSRELPDNPLFTRMLTEELLPFIAFKTNRHFSAERRVLAGSSYGGLGAFTHSFRAPNQFGNAVILSGSFWWAKDRQLPTDRYYASEQVITSSTRPVRFAMTAGLFESSPTGQKGILEGSRHLRDILRVKGYEVHYKEYAGGHDYIIWEQALLFGLKALFPYSKSHQ